MSELNPQPGEIPVEERILSENDRLAAANRACFAAAGLRVLNLVSSPGSGKTTLLVETLLQLKTDLRLAVIEGDQQTDHDAQRISGTGVPVVQINTGQSCHLDAALVGQAYDQIASTRPQLLFIENVGNLICPAEFDLGEDAKVVLMSVTEGEEKPLKYPLIFHLAKVMVLTKIDLLPYLPFNLGKCLSNARQVNPALEILQTSAIHPSDLHPWLAWLSRFMKDE